jgi:aryl-alcohol dehydrogenase-like predicted oxidoreductase
MIQALFVKGSNVSITRLGFGCARIYGGRESRTSARLIEAALAASIRHFDTAPSYGGGLSEAVLGTALAGVRDVTITTKIGIHRPDQVVARYSPPVLYRRFVRPVMSRFPRTKARLLRLMERNSRAVAVSNPRLPRRRLCREEVLRGLEDSLKQLRRNFVDLYLIHEPEQFELTDEVKEVFATLKLSGTIGAFGLAWGRAADIGVGFGTVAQGRYAPDLPSCARAGETRIFHGVLRHHLSESDAHLKDAGTQIRNVLDAHPAAAIIFSASTPFQIDCIVKQLT